MFGLDLALPIGVFTGLAVCVPYLGFGLGLILALLAGLLFGQAGGLAGFALGGFDEFFGAFKRLL